MTAAPHQPILNPNRQRAGATINRTARENFVYWVLDADGNTLYIGFTRCPERRWQNHGYAKPKLVAAAARFRMRGPYTRAVAMAIEKAAIRAENPPFNFEGPLDQQMAKRALIAERYEVAS